MTENWKNTLWPQAFCCFCFFTIVYTHVHMSSCWSLFLNIYACAHHWAYRSFYVCHPSLVHHKEQLHLLTDSFFLKPAALRRRRARVNFTILFISSPHSTAFHLLICTAGAAPKALNQTHDLAWAASSQCICVGLLKLQRNNHVLSFLSGDSQLHLNTRSGRLWRGGGDHMFFVTEKFLWWCECSTEIFFCLSRSTLPLNQLRRKREAPYQGTAKPDQKHKHIQTKEKRHFCAFITDRHRQQQNLQWGH